jgi:hypothetical protein
VSLTNMLFAGFKILPDLSMIAFTFTFTCRSDSFSFQPFSINAERTLSGLSVFMIVGKIGNESKEYGTDR